MSFPVLKVTTEKIMCETVLFMYCLYTIIVFINMLNWPLFLYFQFHFIFVLVILILAEIFFLNSI